MIGLIYAAGAITLIVIGGLYRARREPERRRAYLFIAIGMSIAVLIGTWIAGGFD
jgi:hypothetical protein